MKKQVAKIPALNRHLTRGGIDYPYCMWSNEAMPHRHKFRMKRMKRTPRLTKHKTGICPQTPF